MSGTTPSDSAHQLRLALIEAQYALRAASRTPQRRAVLVLVSGIELAGKGEAVKQLREWMDPRWLLVRAPLPHYHPQQPAWQSYVHDLPAMGELVLLFGNWYGDLLSARLAPKGKRISDAEFDRQMQACQQFEQQLRDDGTIVVKCWFDLSWQTLQQRLDQLDPALQHWQQLHGLNWRKKNDYRKLQHLLQRHRTAKPADDWIHIDSNHAKRRDLQFGHVVLDALRQLPHAAPALSQPWTAQPIPAMLLQPEQQILEKETYQVARAALQHKLALQLRQRHGRPLILLFEGMDAAGKGGAIRRVVAPLDPREYQIDTIAAPEPHEQQHGYLWRFWRKLPQGNQIGIFDRSWYGRVLVERIEQLIAEQQWQAAYAQINRFEQQLSDAGVIVLKFWLAIDPDEQLRRFHAREQHAHKRFKLTPDDWRNRERWNDYLQAAADMLHHTHHAHAPWVVIASNDKYSARLAVLRALHEHLNQLGLRVDDCITSDQISVKQRKSKQHRSKQGKSKQHRSKQGKSD